MQIRLFDFTMSIRDTDARFLIDTDFVALGAENNAWNVSRSEFDELLLKHAAESGAKVFTQTRVDTLDFLPLESKSEATPSDVPPSPSSAYSFWNFGGSRSRSSSTRSQTEGRSGVGFGGIDELGRPHKAHYTKSDGTKGEIEFDFLVDASGRNGLLSMRFVAAFSRSESGRCLSTPFYV